MMAIIQTTWHMRHQPSNTHSPAKAAFLQTSSAKSFSWKSRECAKDFALTFYCIFSIILGTRLKNWLIYTSDLEADSYDPQIAHLASDQRVYWGR